MEIDYYKPCPEYDRCCELIDRYWEAGEYESCFKRHLELPNRAIRWPSVRSAGSI